MDTYSEDFWERCWLEENPTELYACLEVYNGLHNTVIDLFKQNNIKTVCDAACGFGAYTLAFASNGFQVHSFDISKTAIAISKKGLEKYGLDSSNIKVASILDTGYNDEEFDGTIAHAVLDHLTVEDAQKALVELFRITKSGGLIMISFDSPEEDDFTTEHVVLEDGSFQYTENTSRSGMIFHPYDNKQIASFLHGRNIIFQETSRKNDQILILRK